jgi:hypothetical protein
VSLINFGSDDVQHSQYRLAPADDRERQARMREIRDRIEALKTQLGHE